ncbi:hypothetical protein LTR84_001110 [Exophiala bonariae]|uniref:RNA helicase n=1 Tax=Exophiala bonariae TaxID=1690606 RepID=A0AAV9NVX3_9EURO|nr:hypothetical protein LTR84_001110 [Exophiala bonariae]
MPRFVPRQRKHKVLAREKSEKAPQIESNQEQIIPLTQSEKEAKRQKLRDELKAQQPKVSAKKQKRLDKYIENKLRKDETIDLLRKLEQEKEKYDAVVDSSQNLGKRTFSEFVKGQTNGNTEKNKRKRTQKDDQDSDIESEDSFEAENKDAFTHMPDEDHEPMPAPVITNAIRGSGLARPLELDESGLPVIQSRKRGKQRVKGTPVAEELPWHGFDSNSADAEDSLDGEGNLEDSESSDGDDSATSELGTSDEDDDLASEDSDSDSELSSSDESAGEKPKTRKSAFKTWATQQVNNSIGHVPSYTPGEGELLPKPAVKELATPMKVVSDTPTEASESTPNRKAYAVHIDRADEIQQSRIQLPILQREQEIMEAIHNNSVVLVKGDTGSGKTTQVPQFLFEAGYGSKDGSTPGMIGITQPRRVAAVSMAKRVGVELGDHGKKVAYQIRFDSNVSSNTAVKFMTDGILLRELSQDLLLRRYSAIVIDEAHERSVNTDILIGMLSKIVPARLRKTKFNPDPQPLKLIIMSATLNIGDFLHEKLFSPSERPPVVEAEGRQHRVTTHFALRSRPDYVEEVIEKVGRAHRKLPHGGILVFLTGQNEIRQVGDRLRTALAPRDRHNPRQNAPQVTIAASEAPLEVEDMDIGDFKAQDDHDDFDLDILTHSEDEAEAHEFDISDDEDKGNIGKPNPVSTLTKEPYTSVHVLPLYSQLPTNEQLKVFEPPPPGSRLIVLATNVAETSLTIPGIRYVFDSGRSKERKYNLDSGVQSFEVDWISKASAEQRAGRAGRTGPGHCWRLYASAVYEQFFPDHAEPEILRAPAESVVLQLKGFAYPKPIVDFPFPTPPASFTLNKAEQLLRNLGALTTNGVITKLGKQLSVYPLSPRLGKIMAAGVDEPALIWQVLALVAGLAVPEIFITEAQLDLDPSQPAPNGGELYTRADQLDDDARDRRKQEYGRARATLSRHDKTSDAMKLFTAVSMYLDATDKNQFCSDYFLRPKAMAEISQLRSQLESLVRANHRTTISSEIITQSRGSKLSSSRVKQLNIIAASGHIDRVAIRYDRLPTPPDMPVKPRRAIDIPYLPLVPLTDKTSASLTEKAVYIHPSSVLSRLPIKDLPEYIVYSHLQRAQAHTIQTDGISPKTRMFPLTPIDSARLSLLARDTALVEYGKPVARSKVEDLAGLPKRRECWVVAELKVGAGERGGGLGFGWPLPPVKVRQVLDVKSKGGWRVEEVLS